MVLVKERVCHRDEIWEGEKFFGYVSGKPVVLVNVEEDIKAFQGWCPHQDISFEDAELEGCTLSCMAHVWTFDMRTGKGINPKKTQLQEFPVEIDREGMVFVTLLEKETDKGE
ncbi:Rieske 2Fe-2S domain-containing protein [Bacillus benzoevorans]|uniref:Toluene monooxygenase system ferredoxin subunit n=1 Tax=Bacillus benzoevorans TaxID=1456 RepID=A0A7X0HNQ0_9BACI|nr:Rieske 2Fe-2S domain-containing protein [Bacillus benzoevorans]MBB6444150.1 toluene monooxygenase system ferredoxin subunit [Bacillus benzoevorans]